MIIKDHGEWWLYTKPAPAPPLPPCSPDDKEELARRSKLPPNFVDGVLPENIAFAKRADGKDWYDYLDERPFSSGSVVLSVENSIVVGTARDGSMLFPDGVQIIEVVGWQGDDPDAAFLNRRYRSDRRGFDIVPLDMRAVTTLDDLRNMIADLAARVAVLEKRR